MFCSTDDKTQYCYFPTLYYSKLLKTQIDFPSVKNNQILLGDHYFSVENGNSWKQEEIGSTE